TSGLTAALVPGKSPPPPCPSWGCGPPPMFVPSGCGLTLTGSPTAGNASYLRAVVPSTITRPDGAQVVASGIGIGGPTDVVVTDTDGVTALRETYVDYDPYGWPKATGRVVAGQRVAGSGTSTTFDATTGHLLKSVRDPTNGGGSATTIYAYDKGGQLHQIQAPTFTRTIDVDGAGNAIGVGDAPVSGYPG